VLIRISENTMIKRKRTNRQTMKTLQRKLKIEQHEHRYLDDFDINDCYLLAFKEWTYILMNRLKSPETIICEFSLYCIYKISTCINKVLPQKSEK